jgi:archaellum component FlaC
MESVRENWTDERLDKFGDEVNHRFDSVDLRFDVVDQRFDAADQRFGGIDQRLESIDHRFDRVEDQIQGIRGELHAQSVEMKQGFEAVSRSVQQTAGEMNQRFDGLYRWLIGSAATVVLALFGAPRL